MAHIAQSAFAQYPAASGLDISSEIIVCTPGSDISEYQGTRAALEAEGVIPAGTKWPEGFDDLQWEDGKYRYFLRRERPKGVKGPRKQFLDLDWWMLRFDPIRNQSRKTLLIERAEKALQDQIIFHSSEARADREIAFRRYLEALKDENFQAVKALIPGMERPRRGRRPKNIEQSQGESA